MNLHDFVYVNKRLNSELSEKKVCVGVYTPTHTFFSGHFYSGLSSHLKTK